MQGKGNGKEEGAGKEGNCFKIAHLNLDYLKSGVKIYNCKFSKDTHTSTSDRNIPLKSC